MRKKLTAIALSLIFTVQSSFAWGAGYDEYAAETGNLSVLTAGIIGDLNGDEVVDAIDFALIKSYLLGVIKDFPVGDPAVGDLNLDGGINALDLAIMKMYLLGAVDSLPVGEPGQALFINEVMAANTDTLRDGDIEDGDSGSEGGAYSDWIEIYNSGNSSIDLTGYTLSDSSYTWEFPAGTVPAKGHLLVWASDKNKVAKDGQLHTNFKLSASGETLTIKMPDGSVADTVTTGELKNDWSYGRKYDGSAELVIFSKATPQMPNFYSSETAVVKEPAFSYAGGFYTSAINLQLSTDEENARVYYTLDGSDPEPGSEGTFEYIKPIAVKSRAGEPNVLSMISNVSNDEWTKWQAPKSELFKCTTVKAVAVNAGGGKSEIVTNSYFVDKDMLTRYKLPVISIVTDRDNFFDDTIGIYVNGNFENKGREWERPVHIEFFEKDGTLAFSQNIGLRINGCYSKKIPQKSFRLYANHNYDDTDKFEYEIFPDLKKKGNGKKLDSFTTLLLRNAGNDCTWTGTMFRDALTQGLVSHLKIDTMAYRSSVVFLDGEYWGIYNIRERFDDEYLKSHYKADKDKIVMLDVFETLDVLEGESDDYKLYQEDVINYLKNNDITADDTYEYIKTKIDIENYIIYNVAEIFCGNTDWPGNNVSIWRYKTEDGEYHPEAAYGQDGRWRWLLKDTDFGFGFQKQSVTFDSLSYATSEEPQKGGALQANKPWAVFLLKTLIKNSEFRNQFINCFADQLNTSFNPVRVNEKIDALKSGIEDAMPEQCDRWRTINIKSAYEGDPTWSVNVSAVKSYAADRPSVMRKCIVNKFMDKGVAGTAEITVNTAQAEGYVRINTIDIKETTPGIYDSSCWTGIYFKGVPVTLTAFAQKGYRFDHWEGITGVQAAAASITFTPDMNMSIRPVFTLAG
ncbi:dockerin type I repeat protein [Ruminiclostridium sufflavum DSM 19573]|uniref:cellulase n=1 Tax=Ruminiclostridium sufflavum DSM 19573 TaxID=1121337 RepID=A0A318XKG5_9FIRM|nr:CotH kinase family protein [Ruminiclostridium sufflavum]PYG86853.1 dockerin type I repeat protein [Ruminiclostridium sufflavum DSM 19573]